jgi:hypothetical protein
MTDVAAARAVSLVLQAVSRLARQFLRFSRAVLPPFSLMFLSVFTGPLPPRLPDSAP